MAAHFSTLAWKMPWTEELGGLQSTGSQGVGLDWMIYNSQASTTVKNKFLLFISCLVYGIMF